MFNCSKCGECCKHVYLSELYKDFDRGDGTCRYLDLETNLCSIYETRPILCQVDACYEKYFKSKLSLEEYYKINYDACKKLKNKKH